LSGLAGSTTCPISSGVGDEEAEVVPETQAEPDEVNSESSLSRDVFGVGNRSMSSSFVSSGVAVRKLSFSFPLVELKVDLREGGMKGLSVARRDDVRFGTRGFSSIFHDVTAIGGGTMACVCFSLWAIVLVVTALCLLLFRALCLIAMGMVPHPLSVL
jgi:hypothetical protein